MVDTEDNEKSSKAEQFMKKIVDRSRKTNNTRDGTIRIKWRQLDNIQGHVDKEKVIKVKQQRNKAFVGLGSCDNVQTERKILE